MRQSRVPDRHTTCAGPSPEWWRHEQLCKKITGEQFARHARMARELIIIGRRYWILSEPDAAGWKAHVVEVREDGSSDRIGIDAAGETRGAADDAAERKLRRLFQAY
jgi:hypothetical protein